MSATTRDLTIEQTIEQLQGALQDYIEATYHISHPILVAQRQRLLRTPGVIAQKPHLESTPRYQLGAAFRDLGLETSVLSALSALSTDSNGMQRLIHDPPWQHQAEALVHAIEKKQSLIVMTGTGSGKTECFLLPILAKLATEAQSSPDSFRREAALRAVLLYPMNALVNDQLGRLRLLFGDSRLVQQFKRWGGRPVRFARYTSRTLYPGVRSVDKDQQRLAPIGRYYVELLERAKDQSLPGSPAAQKLVVELQKRGKWPAKPDLLAWYGKSGSRWVDSKTGAFRRCVMLPDDSELLTRHEVLENPPDILITNYSMLEYMLMRPLERVIFDRTRDWLERSNQSLLLVVDEAHLYRGAGGTEVALLLRRLRTRLGIPQDRLQVICTSASFQDPNRAAEFATQLTGKDARSFTTIQGNLLLRQGAGKATRRDAEALNHVNLEDFYKETSEDGRLRVVRPFLTYRHADTSSSLSQALYQALVDFPPMAQLINRTMQEACDLDTLATELFVDTDQRDAQHALTVLVALGSLARRDPSEPGLLPCRVHAFYRGVPGLWVCMDPSCTAVEPNERGGPAGRLYSQPRDLCDCGSRVMELYTCRHCGTSYARAYTDDPENPDFLWSESGRAFRAASGQVDELEPLDLLLEEPVVGDVEKADFDLSTGRLNPPKLGPRTRTVYLRMDRIPRVPKDAERAPTASRPGEFVPCAVCGESGAFGRSSVQDHLTKGDQPFQALIAKQIQVQAPEAKPATNLAPLRGRKVLVFSDSRQVAARLAPNLQKYSTQDALRPLILVGYRRLEQFPQLTALLSLEDLYFAVLLASKELGVRLRPELKAGESFHADFVSATVDKGSLTRETEVLQVFSKLRASTPPESLLSGIVSCINDRYYGLESLALASISSNTQHLSDIESLADISGVATTRDQKHALVNAWLRCWRRPGFWMSRMPASWLHYVVQCHSGRFLQIQRFLEAGNWKRFDRDWLPSLLSWFAEEVASRKYRLMATELSLLSGGTWTYCQACRETQRPFPGSTKCLNCGHTSLSLIEPDDDPVFAARKAYYRASTVDAMKSPPIPPMSLIAAEHTAQLNAAQPEDVFSKAEENELLFQDVDLGTVSEDRARPAIDVLSCTTTMEVGIDIGTLSGVSLRNMPPSRANYQQRSGRAGRRGSAVATVTAFGSADSHDEHYFSHPEQMIRGPVDDPTLILDNYDIARRHVTAYLLQRYHQERLPRIQPQQQPSLFAVLGSVSEFKLSTSVLNRNDFDQWLRANENKLRAEVASWLPDEMGSEARSSLLKALVSETMRNVDLAIDYELAGQGDREQQRTEGDQKGEGTRDEIEAEPETGEESGPDPRGPNLLDRLLYKGVLPRYAFPTDVATFHVFDRERSTHYRALFRFTPSQGLPVALSQYAPGKEVWIAGKLYKSGALYSPVSAERFQAWQAKRLYYECNVCHYACTFSLNEGERGDTRDCPACGHAGSFGAAKFWMRPPGFAHPVGLEEGTSPDDQPSRSYATRAKLIAPTPASSNLWTRLNERLRVHYAREHLLVTNSGPNSEGYNYCTKCGLIEPTASPISTVFSAHMRPFPDRIPNCPGGGATKGIVLGTDFISDILLISLRVTQPATLLPGLLATDVALRTLAEAITKAASSMLGLESGELQAEYRPALTPQGRTGEEAEIYLYDTLPGGAGFSRRAGQLGLRLFDEALRVLESCPEQCDQSCYRCLRSYKNKFEHALLDRHLGSSLLHLLLTGTHLQYSADRLERSTEILFQDLERQGSDSVKFERNVAVTIPGLGQIHAPILASRRGGSDFIVSLHSPLTPDDPPTDKLREVREYSVSVPLLLVDELIVRKNLPRATNDLMSSIG